MTMHWCHYASPLGAMRLAATRDGLAGAWFVGQKYDEAPAADWHEAPDDPQLARARAELDDFFAGRRRAFDLKLAPRGTPFQQRVWRAIAAIPAGETISYGELARRAGTPAAVRAAAAATGRNPLSIVVPCHRIVGANGALTGYAGGLERKRALLALEGARTTAGRG